MEQLRQSHALHLACTCGLCFPFCSDGFSDPAIGFRCDFMDAHSFTRCLPAQHTWMAFLRCHDGCHAGALARLGLRAGSHDENLALSHWPAYEEGFQRVDSPFLAFCPLLCRRLLPGSLPSSSLGPGCWIAGGSAVARADGYDCHGDQVQRQTAGSMPCWLHQGLALLWPHSGIRPRGTHSDAAGLVGGSLAHDGDSYGQSGGS